MDNLRYTYRYSSKRNDFVVFDTPIVVLYIIHIGNFAEKHFYKIHLDGLGKESLDMGEETVRCGQMLSRIFSVYETEFSFFGKGNAENLVNDLSVHIF